MNKTFEDLRAFQRALDLMVDVYTVTNNFPKPELYGLTAHLRQAAGTLIGSIAAQRLTDARGSLCELQAHIIAAHKLGFLGSAALEHLRKRARMAAMELAALIEAVRKRAA